MKFLIKCFSAFMFFASISLKLQGVAYAQDDILDFIPAITAGAIKAWFNRDIFDCKVSRNYPIQCNSSGTYYFWVFVDKVEEIYDSRIEKAGTVNNLTKVDCRADEFNVRRITDFNSLPPSVQAEILSDPDNDPKKQGVYMSLQVSNGGGEVAVKMQVRCYE